MRKLVLGIAIGHLRWLLITSLLITGAHAQGTLQPGVDADHSDYGFARKMKTANDSCLGAYGVNDPKVKVMRRLLPIYDEVPITLQDGSITQTMLHLDRKPNADEKVALHAYYDAELACVQAEAKVMAWAGFGQYTQDASTGIPKGWEQNLDEVRQLFDGKLTFAEFNARQVQVREYGAKVLNDAVAGAKSDQAIATQLTAIDTWYRQGLSVCAADDECKWIVKKAYNDLTACVHGDSKACSEREGNEAELSRLIARRQTPAPQTAEQATPQSTLMQCLQDSMNLVLAMCKKNGCRNDLVMIQIEDLQRMRCGYSALQSSRPAFPAPALPAPALPAPAFPAPAFPEVTHCTTQPDYGMGSTTTCTQD